jgi:hypothetical protein
MRRDYLIAIILAFAGLASGAALMVAPEYLHLTGWTVPATFWGGIALTLLLLSLAGIVAWHGAEKVQPPKGEATHSGDGLSAQIVISELRAQILETGELRVFVDYENVGHRPARDMAIEMNISIGELGVPNAVPVFNVKSYPDDLPPNRQATRTLRPDIPVSDVLSKRGKPFGVSAEGAITFRNGQKQERQPFDYWILRKPGEVLAEPGRMLRKPPFMRK